MKEGDLVKKMIGTSDLGLTGIIVKIIELNDFISGSYIENQKYAVVNTSKGVKRWYCSRLEKI